MARDITSVVDELNEAKIEINNLKVKLAALEAACQSLAQDYNKHCVALHASRSQQ